MAYRVYEIHTSKGLFTKTSGTEGPRHDPYHWDEWQLIHYDKRAIYTLHLGLVVRYDRNNETMEMQDEQDAVEQFIIDTGMHMDQWDKAGQKLRSRCRKCGNHRYFMNIDGMPGETMIQCVPCGHIVDVEFNESAVI